LVPYRVKTAKGQRGRYRIRIAAKPFEPRKILCRPLDSAEHPQGA
jgi:hypothetical protein